MQKTCFLIGFMGCGKSFWGTRLATTLGVPFIDLDVRIENGENASIAKIFEQSGESGFRKLEQRYLHELTDLPASIVATGGGTPCFFDNMARINQLGRSIYLDTPAQLLATRLQADKDLRPLLRNVPEQELETHIAQLLLHREPFYRQAQVILVQSVDPEHFWQQLLEAAAD